MRFTAQARAVVWPADSMRESALLPYSQIRPSARSTLNQAGPLPAEPLAVMRP